MPEARTRWGGRPLRAAAAALGAVLCCAAPAGAATTTYPVGAGTFDVDAQGWLATGESCGGGINITCATDATHDGAGGNPGGALATRLDVTLNLLGLFAGAATWTSPTFTLPADAVVSGGTLAFDAAFDASGLNLGLTSDVDVALEDLTAPATTPLATAALADGDVAYAGFGGPVPGGVLVGGHGYRLVVTTTTASSATGLNVLGRATTRVDNLALSVTTVDATTPPPGGRDGDGRGGDGGGRGGDGGAGGTGGGAGTTGEPAGGGGGPSPDATARAAALTRDTFAALLRSLDLNAQTGPLAGGSIVPRRRCTIVGTPRADRLVGTRGIDVICGLGGNDTIAAGGASDLIDGGAGRDRLRGGAGGDVLLGLAGGDRLLGGAGGDVLAGGAGRDRLRGGPAVDRLLGGAGRDVARGGLRTDAASAVERRVR